MLPVRLCGEGLVEGLRFEEPQQGYHPFDLDVLVPRVQGQTLRPCRSDGKDNLRLHVDAITDERSRAPPRAVGTHLG